MSILSNVRDKAVESFIRNNDLVKQFGSLQSLSINSEDCTADISILLNGEIFPIKFRAYYKLCDEDSNTYIEIWKVSCEREWIDKVLLMYLSKKTFKHKLPTGIVSGIAKFLF